MKIANLTDFSGAPYATLADLQALAARVSALEDASYSGTPADPDQGSLAVTYSGTPPEGAAWSVNGGNTWRQFNGTPVHLEAGSYTLTFKQVTGYTAPSSQLVNIIAGQTTTTTAGTYTASPGTLAVSFTGTVPTGAGWSVSGQSYGPYDTATLPAGGPYTVTFSAVQGYTTPADQFATITSGETTTLTAEYEAEQQSGGSGERLSVSGTQGGAYDGDYYLYSGASSSLYSVWRHSSGSYYVYFHEETSSEYFWAIWTSSSGGDGSTRIAYIAYNRNAPSTWSSGLTVSGITTTYHAA